MVESEVIIVVDQEGVRGTAAADQFEDEELDEIVVMFGEQRVLVPADELVLQEDETYLLPIRVADYQTEMTATEGEARVIELIAERADIHKVRRESGAVRIRKVVDEEEELIEVPLISEDVEVTRVAVDRPIDGPIPIREEGNTIILPLIEEVLVVQKQLVLKEEVHISRKKIETTASERVMLRKEDVVVERLDVDE
ncbi:MAG: YsnF/AvaK domain-containing protein [Candidatus Promineifilaceae bacterium]|nr:YsnF/AvaK domain-containing protein [Candidatus Promineifilaceae bacterium]